MKLEPVKTARISAVKSPPSGLEDKVERSSNDPLGVWQEFNHSVYDTYIPHIYIYKCMYVCMYVCMYECM